MGTRAAAAQNREDVERRVNEAGSARLPPLPFADPLVARAEISAHRDFFGKFRKVPIGSGIERPPYSVHPAAVAALVAAAGCDAETIAAAFLHDHLEDLPGTWTRDRLTKEFGARVCELVE